ncbi:hypothetical protein [Bordetella genomosp. 10]|uniref:hypothetical protein n=1 Tax=Bordetella genomosp. 10 TaxID=1416804 RepID=UPI0011781B8F|nr:hypothetical protein [Bordetella genomosp. 10]
MILNKDLLASDLLPFVDIGTNSPKVTHKSNVLSALFVRDGREYKVEVDVETGKISLKKSGFPVKGFSSFAAMLASEDFANLRKWAASQAELLRKISASEKHLLPINGRTHKKVKIEGIQQVNGLLDSDARADDAAEVILIDGPAGIGKTKLVEQLALLRAESYSLSPSPLILHVRSRGRVLSNLQDLMAFSLQTLRSNTTYDQVPILLKHGLITVAVDGFDELGDPNGYELAWSQVNDLIFSARGKGVVLLSGRDTFLGRDRLFRDVKSLRENYDLVTSLTLEPATPTQAQDWLRTKGWTDVHFKIPAVASLLEDGSFALRPVFLNLMATNIAPKRLREETDSFLTPLLVKHMLEREAGLFGDAVESIVPRQALEDFLLRFLIEVARDMADGQAEALDETTLSWLVEMTLGGGYPEEIIRLIRNRASVVAPLKPDIRPGYKGFVHSHLHNYFLSLAVLESIGNGEVPKFLKRNVLGSELIAVFGDVAAKAAESSAPQLNAFVNRSLPMASTYGGVDRAARNAGALVLSTLSLLPEGEIIRDSEIDETVIRGTASRVSLEKVSIHQLDCRSADLSAVSFNGCEVTSLIANDATIFSSSFPSPRQVALEGKDDIVDSREIEDWLTRHGRNATATVATGLASPELAVHPIFKLLGSACRIRQYWLRPGDDIQADKILRNKYWEDLANHLRNCNLLREEARQASGAKSTFTHIRMREKILSEDSTDPDVVNLFSQLNIYAST